jgi:hypothetical protein
LKFEVSARRSSWRLSMNRLFVLVVVLVLVLDPLA